MLQHMGSQHTPDDTACGFRKLISGFYYAGGSDDVIDGGVVRLNFHIYVHGNRSLLEQGEDEKGKFYKVYYEEEE